MCDVCKNYNSNVGVSHCLKCGLIIEQNCKKCRDDALVCWSASNENETLELAIKEFKYKSKRALMKPLAELLSLALPYLTNEVIVIPVPTIAAHIRARGFDHAWFLAKKLASLRNWECKKMIYKIKDTVQVGTDAETRKIQAKNNYICHKKLDSAKIFLVVDDISTTGATLKASCEALRRAGAKNIYAAVLIKST